MRRLVSVLLVAALMLTGCGERDSGMGEWPPMPEGSLVVPAVGQCHDFLGFKASTQSGVISTPTRCELRRSHQEVVYVGTFSGDVARQPAPPAEGSPGRRAAYEGCQPAITEYLGGDWHTARVWMTLVLPTEAAWRAGARWFRCDLAELYASAFRQLVADASKTVKDGLRGNRRLAITCIFHGEYGGVDEAGCDERHAGEFAGTYTAP